MLKNKIFKIAEKSQETRDRCGGNVNHKSLFDSVIHSDP